MKYPMDIDARLKRAVASLQHEVSFLTIPERALIIAETYERPLSPSQFANEWGLDVRRIVRHFDALRDAGYLEEVGQGIKKAGGGRRPKLYRAMTSLLFTPEEWKTFSREEREGHTNVVFVTYLARMSQAMNAGTFDDEIDRHFTWKPIKLDRVGWDDLMALLKSTFYAAVDIEVESATRMQGSGERPIPTTFGLAGFRSPWAKDLIVPGLVRRDWPEDKLPGG
jgi:hypothetical protein